MKRQYIPLMQNHILLLNKFKTETDLLQLDLNNIIKTPLPPKQRTFISSFCNILKIIFCFLLNTCK